MGSQVGAPGTGQCSLSFILDSCESPTELFVKAEDIVLSTVSGHKLPTWSPDTSEAIIKWTHKIIVSKHIPSACCFVRMLTTYTNSNQDVNSYSVLEVYLQMNYFATRTVFQDDIFNQSQLWHSLTGLFFSLIEYHQDAVLNRFCDVGHSLLRPFLDASKPLNMRTRCIKELNELLKLCPSMARDVLKKRCCDLFKCLPSQLQEVGDYDVQASVVESIYRMTSSSERSRFVSLWFPDLDCTLQSLFITISEFDPDCRRFLNAYNASLGVNCKVHTFPCHSAAIGKLHLNKPMSPAYTKFWVDFNLGSETILLLCQKPVNPATESTEDPPWESLVLYPQDIQKVTLTRTVQVYTLEIFMVNVESVADMFASPLSQQSRLLLSQSFVFEFAPLETLERVCAIMYAEKFHVVVLEPEGWVHAAARNASAHSGEGFKSSASSRRYKKCSMNIVHCKASGTSTSDPQSEVCIAKKRKVEQMNPDSVICVPPSQSPNTSSYKKQRKSSIAYTSDPFQNVPEMAVDKDRLAQPKETSQKHLGGKFTKTSRCSLHLDFDMETMADHYSEISKETKLCHERKEPMNKKDHNNGTNFTKLKEREGQPKESPDINTTSQDVVLLNLAMDSLEGHVEHEKRNISNLSQKKPIESKGGTPSEDEVIPCSLSTQEKISYLNTRVTPKCRKTFASVSSAFVRLPGKLNKSFQNLCHSKHVSDKARYVFDAVTCAQEKKGLGEQDTKKSTLPVKKDLQDVKDKAFYSAALASSKLKNAGDSHNTKALKVTPKLRDERNFHSARASKKTPTVESEGSSFSDKKASKPTKTSQSKKNKRSKKISLATKITKVYPLRNRIKSQDCNVMAQHLSVPKANAQKNMPTSAKSNMKQTAKFVDIKTKFSPKTSNLSVNCYSSLKFTSPGPGSPTSKLNSRPNKLSYAHQHAIKRKSQEIHSPGPNTVRSSPHVSDSEGADKIQPHEFRSFGAAPVHDHQKVGYVMEETHKFVIPVTKILELSTGASHQQPGLLHIAPPRADTSYPASTNAESVHPITPRRDTSSPTLSKVYTEHFYVPKSYGTQTATVEKHALLPDSPRAVPVQHDPSGLDNPYLDTHRADASADTLQAAPPEVYSKSVDASEVATLQSCTLKCDTQSPKTPEDKTVQEAIPVVDDKRCTAPEANTKSLDIQKLSSTPRLNRPDTPWPVIHGHDTPRPKTSWHGTHWPEAHRPDTPLANSCNIDAVMPATTLPSPCKPAHYDPDLKPVSPKSTLTSPTLLKFTPFKPISPKATSYQTSPLKTTVIPASLKSTAVCEAGLSQTVSEITLMKDNDNNKQLLEPSCFQSIEVPELHIYDVKMTCDSSSVTELRHQVTESKFVLSREINLLNTVCQITNPEVVELNSAVNSGIDVKDIEGMSPHSDHDRSRTFIRQGSRKSPSKGLVSSLMILADYPVKPIGFKTPSKVPYCTDISKLGSRSADCRPKSQTEKKERWKSYESLYYRNRNCIPSTETKVNFLKSKKKLFDTTAISMLDASPPDNGADVCTVDDDNVEVPCNSSVQPSEYIVELEEVTSTKCQNVANTDVLSSEKRSKIPIKEEQSHSSADSKKSDERDNIKYINVNVNEKKYTKTGSRFRSFHKSTNSEKGEDKNTSSTAVGFFEFPGVQESVSNVSHGVYSDFDSSGKETEHSWLYGQKKFRKFEGSTYFNRTKSHSRSHAYEVSSDDEWQPCVKKKRKPHKGMNKHLGDIDMEAKVSRKPRQRRKLRKCKKVVSNTETSTGVETDNTSLKRDRKNFDSATHKEESDVQNESSELLRHTSKSSAESNTPSVMEFKLAAVKGKDLDDRYKKVRADIEESFGFSSPELSESPKVKEPQQKRVRKSVEDAEIKAMIENILPQQQKVPGKLIDVRAVDTYGIHVPDPPNNTPVSLEVEQLTQTFDINEISEIDENKPDPQNSPNGRLHSTLIHETDQHLVLSARFSYVSEAETSYIDSRGNDMSKNKMESLNASVNETEKNYTSPSPKSGISSKLKFDNDSDEESIQEPFDMIPQHSWMSSSDEHSSVVEEAIALNENVCSKEDHSSHLKPSSATTQASSLAPSNPLLPEDSLNSQDLFSQEKSVDLPTPSLQNHGTLSQEKKKQNLDATGSCEDDNVRNSSETSAALSSLLNKLTDQAFSEPATQHQSPSTTKIDQTPVRPVPRVLFSTLEESQAMRKERPEGTEKASQSSQMDCIDTLRCIKTCVEDVAESLYRLSAAIGNSLNLTSRS